MIFRIIVWVVMLFGGVAGGYYLDYIYFNGIHNNWKFHLISFIIGVWLLRIVMKISRNTGRTLAKYGRKGDVPRLDTNILVTQGPYKYMRHPMHLGLLMFPPAIAFLVGSPSFILLIAPLEIIFMLVMIKLVEEPEVKKKFGKQYEDYIKDKPWFCLRKECINELLRDVPKEK